MKHQDIKFLIVFLGTLGFLFFALDSSITGKVVQTSFCDDFESYMSGSYLASSSSSWTTWTQPYTAMEDVQVTNALSNSGSNSI